MLKEYIKYMPVPAVASLPRVILGRGGYGVVEGPTEEAIRAEIARARGVRRDRIRVEKTYHKTKSMKDAVRLQKLVNKIDPSRVYLRGKIVETDSTSKKVLMPHEGKSLENITRTPENRKLFFESFYQLLHALVLLQEQGYVHHDVKRENITMDTRTVGGQHTATLGLIDFDLLAKKGAHEVTHSKYPYFVYPLETFYDPVHDRFTIFDDKRHPHPDPVEARRILAGDYLINIAFLRKNPKGVEAFRQFFRHLQDPATQPFPSIDGLDPVVEFYLLNLSIKSLRKNYMKRDGNKVDTFGLGQVLYSMLHGYENALFAGHPQKDALVVSLKTFIQWMLHPVPSIRHDAKAAMAAWLNLLSVYNPSMFRKACRQLHLPLPASSIRFNQPLYSLAKAGSSSATPTTHESHPPLKKARLSSSSKKKGNNNNDDDAMDDACKEEEAEKSRMVVQPAMRKATGGPLRSPPPPRRGGSDDEGEEES